MEITLRPDIGHYTPNEQEVISQLALRLKHRDHFIQCSDYLHPKHYMPLYTRAAAGIYEMAKTLSRVEAPGLPRRGVGDWIAMLSGIPIPTALHLDRMDHVETKLRDVQTTADIDCRGPSNPERR